MTTKKGEANIYWDEFELFISHRKNHHWIDEIKSIFMIYNTNFLCSLQFPNFSIFYFRLQGGNYTFPKLTRTEKSWLPFFVCHVIFHAYFNFTYAIPGRFYIKVAVYTNGFMSVRLSKIVIWDWVENFTLENVKSTLKYGIITYKHSLYCMWILHLSSSWSNSVKKLSHTLGRGLIFTSIHPSRNVYPKI